MPTVLITTYKVTGGGSRPPTVEIHFRSTSDSAASVVAYGSIGTIDCTDDPTVIKKNGDLAFENAKALSRLQKGFELTVPPHADMHFPI